MKIETKAPLFLLTEAELEEVFTLSARLQQMLWDITKRERVNDEDANLTFNLTKHQKEDDYLAGLDQIF